MHWLFVGQVNVRDVNGVTERMTVNLDRFKSILSCLAESFLKQISAFVSKILNLILEFSLKLISLLGVFTNSLLPGALELLVGFSATLSPFADSFSVEVEAERGDAKGVGGDFLSLPIVFCLARGFSNSLLLILSDELVIELREVEHCINVRFLGVEVMHDPLLNLREEVSQRLTLEVDVITNKRSDVFSNLLCHINFLGGKLLQLVLCVLGLTSDVLNPAFECEFD